MGLWWGAGPHGPGVMTRYFGTLRVHGASYMAGRILTFRGQESLPNTLKYGLGAKGTYVNADFAEEIYGVPHKWTSMNARAGAGGG